MFGTPEFIRAWYQAARPADRGASLVEYALLLALIAVVCLVAVTTMGTKLESNYDESQTSIFGG
jgi:pilus assembly protein Flp/PilA